MKCESIQSKKNIIRKVYKKCQLNSARWVSEGTLMSRRTWEACAQVSSQRCAFSWTSEDPPHSKSKIPFPPSSTKKRKHSRAFWARRLAHRTICAYIWCMRVVDTRESAKAIHRTPTYRVNGWNWEKLSTTMIRRLATSTTVASFHTYGLPPSEQMTVDQITMGWRRYCSDA